MIDNILFSNKFQTETYYDVTKTKVNTVAVARDFVYDRYYVFMVFNLVLLKRNLNYQCLSHYLSNYHSFQ